VTVTKEHIRFWKICSPRKLKLSNLINACGMGLVSKHRDRAYRGGPCHHWVK
jgi:hypothetical protein